MEVRPKLTVWFDGECPICAAEIGLLRHLDRQRCIDFVDLRPEGVCPLDRDARLARLHAQPAGSDEVSGAAAFVEIWRVIPYLRPFAMIAGWPPALGALERAYRFFLRIRPGLQAVLRARSKASVP